MRRSRSREVPDRRWLCAQGPLSRLQKRSRYLPLRAPDREAITTERIKAILDAVTDRVLAYRPKDKGQQAKKIEQRVKRQRKAKADE